MDVFYDAMIHDEGRAMFLAVVANYADGIGDTVLEMIRHPATVLGLGDGGADCLGLCDATTPTTVLAHWVRDRTRGPRLPVEIAVRELTANAALAFGLADRGTLVPGMRADINVIDLEALQMRVPEFTADLPANGVRMVQRATGYVATYVAGTQISRMATRRAQGPGAPFAADRLRAGWRGAADPVVRAHGRGVSRWTPTSNGCPPAAARGDGSSESIAGRGDGGPAGTGGPTRRRSQPLHHGGRSSGARGRVPRRTGNRVGDPLGPLHGVPVCIKDLFWTKGIRTTYGSKLFEDFVPESDAIFAERLRGAGAIIFAKNNTPEFGMNRRSLNLVARECLTPWDPSLERSRGIERRVSRERGRRPWSRIDRFRLRWVDPDSVVLQRRLRLLGKPGSDPGGPSTYKAPMQGLGPMTRDVRDAALVMSVIAGPDHRDWWCSATPAPDYLSSLDEGVEGVRVAWSPDLGRIEPARPDVVEVAHQAPRRWPSRAHLHRARASPAERPRSAGTGGPALGGERVGPGLG